jgi:hypothetical protein
MSCWLVAFRSGSGMTRARLRSDMARKRDELQITVAGLTCRNRSGHGFFLSRAHTYLF